MSTLGLEFFNREARIDPHYSAARRGAHSDTLEAKNNLIRVLHFIGSDRSVTIVPLINPPVRKVD